MEFFAGRVARDAAYIIYYLSERITACSFNSERSVETERYAKVYSFFLHLLLLTSPWISSFFPPQLRFAFFPSYHILDHHLICPRILLLPEMSRECITAAWRIHLSTTTTRFESIPGFAEKYTSFLTPRRHRDASLGAAPDNRIVCYTTVHLSRRGFSCEKTR